MTLALLYQQIRDAILVDIRNGKLKPGDPIPSELDLAKQFGVSRITSKKALDTLRQDGVVVRERGRGTFVASGASSSPALPTSSIPRRIGFVVPDMSDTFGVRMLDGIDEQVRSRGYQLVLRRTHGNVEEETRAIAEFVASGVDGLIVFPVHGEFYNAELLRHVIAGFPVVLVDRVLPGIPVSSVCTDNVRAASRLTTYLIDRGHASIAFVSPPPNHTSSIEQRLRGFRAALRKDVSGSELTTIECTLPGKSIQSRLETDRQRILTFLEAHPDVTGFVACEYTLALLVELVLREAGKPPAEIVCFDSAWEPFDRYPFTHIRQNERQIGVEAVDLLISHIESSTPPRNLAVAFDLVETNRD
jgi:DNA-binding LacI/PurR family transcriptional regulator/biotin operon repressor